MPASMVPAIEALVAANVSTMHRVMTVAAVSVLGRGGPLLDEVAGLAIVCMAAQAGRALGEPGADCQPARDEMIRT